MHLREIKASLGGNNARLVIEVTGEPCAIDDLVLKVHQVLRDARGAKPKEKKPCGCKDKT